jgi:hypothetical protein
VSVYFVTCRDAGAVKIGFSVEPRARLPEIQWGCPLPLTLEAVFPGDIQEEKRFHRWFADDRIIGEWFRLTEMIELIIKNNAVPHLTGLKRKRTIPSPRPKRWHSMSIEEKYAALMAEKEAV